MADNIKLYPPLVRGVVACIREIFHEGRYADKVIQYQFKSNPKWGSRDRAFIAENVYEMVRWWRLLRKIDSRRWENDGKGSGNDIVRLLGINLLLKGHDLPDWEEFKDISKKAVQNKKQKLAAERKIIQSIPDWLDTMAFEEIGDQWDKEIIALNESAQVVLRINTLKTTKRDLKKILLKDGWDTLNTPIAKDALILKKEAMYFPTHSLKRGFLRFKMLVRSVSLLFCKLSQACEW